MPSSPKPDRVPLLSETEEAELQHRMAADSDARELTDAELGRMRPARDVLPPSLFTALAKRGRPRSAVKRGPVTLRVDPTILDAYKAGGPGWQTRMNVALAQGIAGIEAPGLGGAPWRGTKDRPVTAGGPSRSALPRPRACRPGPPAIEPAQPFQAVRRAKPPWPRPIPTRPTP